MYDHEEIPIPLTRRTTRRRRFEAEQDSDPETEAFESSRGRRQVRGIAAEAYDRMSPKVAGGIMGFFAGAAGLGVVHLVERARIDHAFAVAATNHAVPHEAVIAIGYLTAAASGALIGACFATVTRHLRRFVPLVVWALVFFVSLTMLVLATARSYGNAAAGAMAPAVLGAAAAYGLVAAFQLPLRRRDPR
ncbi:MAG: hypothetical protein JST00_42390 [Deltaproteobacteria bacterium]|nr:hypothetical protein [Deltaproteobacteria bacterium]